MFTPREETILTRLTDLIHSPTQSDDAIRTRYGIDPAAFERIFVPCKAQGSGAHRSSQDWYKLTTEARCWLEGYRHGRKTGKWATADSGM